MPCGVAIPGEFAVSDIALIDWTKKKKKKFRRKPWQKKCISLLTCPLLNIEGRLCGESVLYYSVGNFLL